MRTRRNFCNTKHAHAHLHTHHNNTGHGAKLFHTAVLLSNQLPTCLVGVILSYCGAVVKRFFKIYETYQIILNNCLFFIA